MKKLSLFLMTIFLLCACSSAKTDTENHTNGQSGCDITVIECENGPSQRKEGWQVKDVLSEDIKVISLEESLEHLNGNVILFFSFNDCPWCYDALPVFEEVMDENNLEFYYVEVKREEREEGNDAYDLVYERFKDYCGDKLYMPFAVFIKDGEVAAFNIGTVEGHEKVDGVLPLIGEEQKIQLKEIYLSCIRDYTE